MIKSNLLSQKTGYVHFWYDISNHSNTLKAILIFKSSPNFLSIYERMLVRTVQVLIVEQKKLRTRES